MANVDDKCPGCGIGIVEEQPAGISRKNPKKPKAYPAFKKCSEKCGWTENFEPPATPANGGAATQAIADVAVNRRCALEQAVRLYGDKPGTLALILETADDMLAWLEGKETGNARNG